MAKSSFKLQHPLDNLDGDVEEPVEDGDTALHLVFMVIYLVLSFFWKGELLWRQKMKMVQFLCMMLVLAPLHHAARGEHLDTIRLLMSHGASLTTKNSYEKAYNTLRDIDAAAKC
ncbi:uncharacterized protein LOC141634362 [Silene latifolia]|uniref:uncharacterized protein LOC141634362 n=1 Tax=Silene latifolia TaxID=37657 RepID=UPI003D78245D